MKNDASPGSEELMPIHQEVVWHDRRHEPASFKRMREEAASVQVLEGLNYTRQFGGLGKCDSCHLGPLSWSTVAGNFDKAVATGYL